MCNQIDPKALDANVFGKLADDWALVTAGTADRCSTMTVSWGGMGVLWGKPVATIYIRPQRYTKEFIDREPRFTLAFFGPEQHKNLQFCGSRSGRDVDKVSECGFTVRAENGAPYFEEAQLVLVCRKLYAQRFDPACFIDKGLDGQNYPQKDYHEMYVGEIETILKK